MTQLAARGPELFIRPCQDIRSIGQEKEADFGELDGRSMGGSSHSEVALGTRLHKSTGGCIFTMLTTSW